MTLSHCFYDLCKLYLFSVHCGDLVTNNVSYTKFDLMKYSKTTLQWLDHNLFKKLKTLFKWASIFVSNVKHMKKQEEFL